jgi:hypothetical protein
METFGFVHVFGMCVAIYIVGLPISLGVYRGLDQGSLHYNDGDFPSIAFWPLVVIFRLAYLVMSKPMGLLASLTETLVIWVKKKFRESVK